MVIISGSKKANKNDKKKTENKPKFERKREYKNPELCSCKGCKNRKMNNSDVCIECYEKISLEMSKTVKNEDSKPLKLSKNVAYNEFMKSFKENENEID